MSAITSPSRSSAPSGCRTAAISAPSWRRKAWIKASPIPYTLVRATQFFEFIRTIADISMVDGAVRLPHTLFQPMAAQDVAAAVAEAALAAPVNGMREVGGPAPVHLDDMIAKVLAFDKDPRRVITDPAASYYGIKVDDRSLVPGPDARLGSTTIDWWLANVPRRRRSSRRHRQQERIHRC